MALDRRIERINVLFTAPANRDAAWSGSLLEIKWEAAWVFESVQAVAEHFY